jgi:ABC-type spermidine/putrescine transport system permease subunit II
MTKTLKNKMMAAGAATFIGMVSGVESAFAQGNNFNKIIQNMETSISGVPGLISGVSYMMGILLGVLGILKIKDHVENPGQTKLQDGAIRLAAGGGLFALPIVYEAMRNTIGDQGQLVEAPKVKGITLDVQQ